ncbi:MAG: hypothetical protein HY308_09560 [Gammaproteobacteria bacterium]|nr:hypothetical protein [Gammaproteobacteria bacterium]
MADRSDLLVAIPATSGMATIADGAQGRLVFLHPADNLRPQGSMRAFSHQYADMLQ